MPHASGTQTFETALFLMTPEAGSLVSKTYIQLPSHCLAVKTYWRAASAAQGPLQHLLSRLQTHPQVIIIFNLRKGCHFLKFTIWNRYQNIVYKNIIHRTQLSVPNQIYQNFCIHKCNPLQTSSVLSHSSRPVIYLHSSCPTDLSLQENWNCLKSGKHLAEITIMKIS